MPLLERDGLLASLRGHLAETRRGGGRLVIVSGEAGIGKTALVEAFVAGLPRGTRWLRGACDPVVPARPFAPVDDMAGQLRGGLRAALASEDRDRVIGRFLDVLRELGSGSVVVFEDLHWVDSATLDLLRVAGRRLASTPVLIVGTVRGHDVDAEHPLRLALGDIPSRLVSELSVPALSLAAVGSLVAGTGIDPADLHGATGGNPFFVTEAVAAGNRTVPVTIRDAVSARIRRMSPEAHRVLHATAVLGPRAERALVLAVAEGAGGPAGLRECVARELLEDHVEGISFRHDLARRTVLDALPAPERGRLHARALAALRSGVAPADAVRLAQHAIEAGDADAIVQLAPRAAERAAGLGAHGEAADLLTIVLAIPAADDDRSRADLLERYAEECSLCDRIAAARSAQERALETWRRVGDRRREGNGLRALSTYMWLGGEGDRARATAESAVGVLEAIEPNGLELAAAYAKFAQLLTNSDQDDVTAGRAAHRALDLAERLGSSQIAVHALTTLALIELVRDRERSWTMLEDALARSRAAGLHEDTARILINLVETARDLKRFHVAERYAAEAVAFLRDRPFDLYRNLLQARVAQLAFEAGRWDEAEREAQALLDASSRSNQARVRALEVIGRIRAYRGEGDAWSVLDEALAAVGPGELQDLCPLHLARAEAAWLQGDLDRAGDEAMRARRLAEADVEQIWHSEYNHWARKTERVSGPPIGAFEPYALHWAGRFRDAATAWSVAGSPLQAALALADSPEEADLREALSAFQRLGARVMVARITRRLGEMGARGVSRGPRPSTRANPRGLTRREVDVLRLLVANVPNLAIAERLVVSPKTIEHHISAIYRKLGVENRTAACRLAIELGIQDGGAPSPT